MNKPRIIGGSVNVNVNRSPSPGSPTRSDAAASSSSAASHSSSAHSLPRLVPQSQSVVGGGNFPGDSFGPAKVELKGSKTERLSGLRHSRNDSGLYSELTSASTPSRICVRCGTSHASMCMPCVDLQCENIITFYRRTRAAGKCLCCDCAAVMQPLRIDCKAFF
jgi:hypothetical protein